MFRRLADAVAPEGTLLIVSHRQSDVQTTIPRNSNKEMYFTASDAAEALDSEDWDIIIEGKLERSATNLTETRSPFTIRASHLRMAATYPVTSSFTLPRHNSTATSSTNSDFR